MGFFKHQDLVALVRIGDELCAQPEPELVGTSIERLDPVELGIECRQQQRSERPRHGGDNQVLGPHSRRTVGMTRQPMWLRWLSTALRRKRLAHSCTTARVVEWVGENMAVLAKPSVSVKLWLSQNSVRGNGAQRSWYSKPAKRPLSQMAK